MPKMVFNLRNPRPELIGYHDEMLNAKTVLQITFLEDVLTVMNILSLVLQPDRKDFGAAHTLSTTLTTLNGMQNISSVHLKSFHAYQDVLLRKNRSQKIQGETYKKLGIFISLKSTLFSKICYSFKCYKI